MTRQRWKRMMGLSEIESETGGDSSAEIRLLNLAALRCAGPMTGNKSVWARRGGFPNCNRAKRGRERTDPSGGLRRIGVLALLDRTPHARDEVVARGLAIPNQAVLGARRVGGRGEAGGQRKESVEGSRDQERKRGTESSQCADWAGEEVSRWAAHSALASETRIRFSS